MPDPIMIPTMSEMQLTSLRLFLSSILPESPILV